MKQIHINVVCDENAVADSLRKIANAYEECDGEMHQYEDARCCAEIS